MAWCKVRGMFNDQGRPISKAEPGSAVEIIGWRELPHAGDTILQVQNEVNILKDNINLFSENVYVFLR